MVSQIIATGSYVPERIIKNSDLTQFPASAIPLIATKTGVRERRHAAEGQTTSDLGIEAAQRCLRAANLAAEDVDAIILATSSPDQPMPATATRIQAKLGCSRAFAFDINAVCTGGVYALTVADSLIRAGIAGTVLVVAAELYSRFLNPVDFSTYPYFGDGAGALLLRGVSSPSGPWLRGSCLYSDGNGANLIEIIGGGTRVPALVAERKQTYFQMNGKAVFEFATTRGSELIESLCSRFSIPKGDLDWIFLHQANVNIISKIAQTTGIPEARFPMNLDRYGNTAAASTFIAVDETIKRDELGKMSGHSLIVAFGGGLTWGGMVIAPASLKL